MANYEMPELFKIGAVEGVVFGDKNVWHTSDNTDSAAVSRMEGTALDID